jgi:hypothetical protein
MNLLVSSQLTLGTTDIIYIDIIDSYSENYMNHTHFLCEYEANVLVFVTEGLEELHYMN